MTTRIRINANNGTEEIPCTFFDDMHGPCHAIHEPERVETSLDCRGVYYNGFSDVYHATCYKCKRELEIYLSSAYIDICSPENFADGHMQPIQVESDSPDEPSLEGDYVLPSNIEEPPQENS